jgi:conjugal transfer pilus assembly protein TraI
MLEREIAFLRDGDGDRFYYISPDVITEKIPDMRMKAIRLRDQALISSMPLESVKGVVHSIRKPDKSDSEGVARAAKNGAAAQTELSLPLPFEQGVLAAPVVKPVTTETAEITAVEEAPRARTDAPIERLGVEHSVSEDAPVAPLAATVIEAQAQQTVSAEPLSLSSLDGAMGELLRVLHADFKSGKKSFEDIAVKQADKAVYLKWPDAFAGYGFTPKQILTDLSELGWMIPASEVAKAGDATFKNGVAKSIKLSPVVGHLFGAQSAVAPQSKAHKPEHSAGVATVLPLQTQLIADTPTATQLTIDSVDEDKKPKKKRQSKNSKPIVVATPNELLDSPHKDAEKSYRVHDVLTKKTKGKSIVETD